ncbi:MAG: hypothetical protein NWR72_08630 [Bacteroidia bacterium]|nr:hypothetical protein [Bacteroidia bacterium]
MTTISLPSRHVLVLLGAMLLLPSLFAQPGSDAPSAVSDPEVLLQELGYMYEMTEGGNFRCVFEVGEEGRTQLVIINTAVYVYGQLEIREIISLAGRFKKMDKKVMLRLLQDSGEKKLGTWSVEQQDDGDYYVYFTARIAGSTSAPALNSAIQLVAESADEMEQEITSGDEF